MNYHFKSILYLDDMRTPIIFGIDVVRSYEEFVWFLENKELPEFISLDHDLSFEHYPLAENQPGTQIPYETYKEKTGLHAARYVVEKKLPIQFWACHSMNVQGRLNIENELRAAYPHGHVKGAVIPYRIAEAKVPSVE
jgi:hypothetical protein